MLKRILTTSGYVLLTAAVIALTAGLVAYGNGYGYNFKTHKFIRTGLIIIQSVPSGLSVTLQGKQLKKKTPYRVSEEAGSFRISLNKDGFYPWTKLVKVIASEVSLVQYVLLIPKQPQTTTLDTRTAITSQDISRDHKHLAYVVVGTESAVYTLDVSNQSAKPVRLYLAKAATATVPAETLTSVAWSDDASHLIVVSNVGGTVTHYLISANGSDVKNLTAQYGFNFTGIKFSSNNWQQLYWISPDGLRRLDVGSQSVSGVLADKVSQFNIADNRVLYVQQTDLGRTLWSTDGRGNNQELIQALPESDSYSIDSTRYNNQDYLSVVPSKTAIGTLYSGIYDANPVSKVVARDVTLTSFSPDGHLAVYRSDTSVVTYDLERSEVDNQTVVYDFPTATGAITTMTWFDDFHLLIARGDHLIWSEFDGANQVDMGPVSDTLPAYSTSDLKSIISIKTVDSAVHIVETLIRP
jgi:hypothetical protein